MYQNPMPSYAPPAAPPSGPAPMFAPPQGRRGLRFAALIAATLVVIVLIVSVAPNSVSKARTVAYPKPILGQITFTDSSNSSGTTLHSGDTLTFSVAVIAGNDLTYSWDFGDGSSGSGAHPTHTYQGYAQQLGVSVQVSDPISQRAIARPLTLSVLPPPPTAAFTIDYTNSRCYSYYYNECFVYVDASNSSESAPQVRITYNWNWGDGTTENGDYYSQARHTYPDQAASYTITLTVSDQFNQTATASQVYSITNP